MEGLAGKITSSLLECSFACHNCINAITSTADEYNFALYNCLSNITVASYKQVKRRINHYFAVTKMQITGRHIMLV